MFQISHAMVVGDNTKQRLRTNTATPTRAKNFIDGNYAGSGNPITGIKGIDIATSPNCIYQCDSMIRCEWALHTIGNSTNSRIYNTAMRDCIAGVVLNGQGAQLGDQYSYINPVLYTNDNRWWNSNGTWFANGHTRAISGANGANTPFYFRNPGVGLEFFPSPFLNKKDNDPNSIITPTNVWSNVPALTGCFGGYNTNKTSSTFTPATIAIAEKIATGEMKYTEDMNDALQQWDRETLYKQLKDDEDLRSQSEVLDSFYTANQNTELSQTIEARQAAGFANNATTADAALSQIEALSPQSQSEQNTQTIQSIYLQTYGRGNTTLDSAQLSTVKGIAEQCFVFGGPSVFLARSMYYAAIGAIDNSFADYCMANYNSYKTENETNKSVNAIVKVYPNPSGEQYGFFITTNFAGNMKMYNAVGQLVNIQNLIVGSNQVSSVGFSKGIYEVAIEMVTGDIVRKKIVLQ